MKKCPFCAEEIQDAAIVCKHCGRDLPPEESESSSYDFISTEDNDQKKNYKRILIIVFSILIGLFIFPCLVCQCSDGIVSEPTEEPTLTSEPTEVTLAPPIYEIFSSIEGMTDAQINSFKDSLIGSYVKDWQGTVEEVEEHEIMGSFTVYVNMVETKYWADVHITVSEDVALSLNKDQYIVFSGIIKDVNLTEYRGMYVSIGNSTVETEPRPDLPTPYPRYTPEGDGILDTIIDFLDD